MNLEPVMLAKLAADTGVTRVIGDRVYPHYSREADRVCPLAVYRLENESEQMASDGPTGLVTADFVIAAIAPTKKQAAQVAETIKAALNGKTWTDTDNAVNVQGSFLADDGRRDDVVTEQDSEEILYFVAEVTFNVFANSTT